MSQPELHRLVLEGGGTRVVLVPALGGKILELHAGGRQWLWSSDVIPLAPGVDGASYALTADSGGMDECFPTVGPCRLPGDVPGYGGLSLPDHGELWAQAPAFDASAGEATCTWTGRRMRYRLVRRLAIGADGAVTLDYTLNNDGAAALPFLWSSHPLFPLTPATRLELPTGARLRVWDWHGLPPPRGPEHRWPRIATAAGELDCSHPWSIAERFACKLFLDVSTGGAGLVEDGIALRFGFDPGEVTHVGLWLNRRGWTPFPDREPYLNLALEPALGAPDTLTDALAGWASAHWLAPGAERRWRMTVSANPAAGTAP